MQYYKIKTRMSKPTDKGFKAEIIKLPNISINKKQEKIS
jgi:hypothetical protein